MMNKSLLKSYRSGLALICLPLFFVSGIYASDKTLYEKVCDISGGCYYEMTISAEISNADKTNLQALAACYFTYTSQGKSVRADEGRITGFVPANPYVGYEYLFADRAMLTEDVGRWFFQVRAPSRADKLKLELKAWRNISALKLKDVVIRKMSCLPEIVGAGNSIKKRFKVTEQENTLFAVL